MDSGEEVRKKRETERGRIKREWMGKTKNKERKRQWRTESHECKENGNS